MTKNHRQTLFWLAIATPVVVHVVLLYLYAVNAPRLDDFSEILTFLPDWHTASNMQDKFAVLFRDYQNHRYVLYHTLLVLFDHINFRTATLAGNTALPLLCALMMLSVRAHPQRYTLWLIAPLLVFNLQAANAMFWGPLGTTNLLYPAVGLLCCWLASQKKHTILAAAIVAIILTLSHGSGPLLFPVVGIHLWRRYGKNSPSTIYWLALSALVFIGYFLVFPLQGEAGYGSHVSMELLQNFFSKSSLIVQGFFALSGSHLLPNDTDNTNEILATIIGISEMAALCWLTHAGALRNYPAIRLWLFFLALATLGIATGRVAYAGLPQAMQGHYKLLNGLLLWILAVAILQQVSSIKPAWISRANFVLVLIAALLYANSFRLFLPTLQEHQSALLNDVRQWQSTGKLDLGETVLYVKQPNKKLKAAIEGGFYNPDD